MPIPVSFNIAKANQVADDVASLGGSETARQTVRRRPSLPTAQGFPHYNGWDHRPGDIALRPVIVALLDACVLYPSVLRETLLQIAAAGHFQPVWSDRIVAELIRHQVAHGRLTPDAVSTLRRRLAAVPGATVTVDDALLAVMTNHPKDRHVLAAAVTAGAGCLVTANLKDFPPPATVPHGLTVQHPAAFLRDRYVADPTGITGVLRRLAAGWAPPVPLETLLHWLQTTAPRFARTVRADLDAGGVRPASPIVPDA